jgi:hypothetical protein
MIVDNLFLVIMGSTLTLLALVSGFFIVVEVVVFVRDFGRGRPDPGWQSRPTVRSMADLSAPSPASGGDLIHPMRDAEVVRQLIEHLKSPEET